MGFGAEGFLMSGLLWTDLAKANARIAELEAAQPASPIAGSVGDDPILQKHLRQWRQCYGEDIGKAYTDIIAYIDSLRAQRQEAAPVPVDRADKPQELALCESVHLGLRADQPYIFRVHAGCAECESLNAAYSAEALASATIPVGALPAASSERAKALEDAATLCETAEVMFEISDLQRKTKLWVSAKTAMELASMIRALKSAAPSAEMLPQAAPGEVQDAARLNLIEQGVREHGYFYIHDNKARLELLGLGLLGGSLRDALDGYAQRRAATQGAETPNQGEQQ